MTSMATIGSGICGFLYALCEVAFAWDEYSPYVDSFHSAVHSESAYVWRLTASFAAIGFLAGIATAVAYSIGKFIRFDFTQPN